MKIAFCIFGFARTIHNTDTIIRSLKKSLPTNSTIDIFWHCPTLLDSEGDIYINKDELINNFVDAHLGNVNISFFEYDPIQFYDKVIELGFTIKSIQNINPTLSRQFSAFYNQSKSINLAYKYSKENSIEYDWVVLTRNDYIPYIINFGVPDSNNIKTKGVYIYRTSPYRTSLEQTQNGVLDTEDRGYFGSPEYMLELRNFYDTLHNIYKKNDNLCIDKLYPENIHTLFFYYSCGADLCYYIEGSNIQFLPNRKTIAERSATNNEIEYYIRNKK
jgi:hypothetical protein